MRLDSHLFFFTSTDIKTKLNLPWLPSKVAAQKHRRLRMLLGREGRSKGNNDGNRGAMCPGSTLPTLIKGEPLSFKKSHPQGRGEIDISREVGDNTAGRSRGGGGAEYSQHSKNCRSLSNTALRKPWKAQEERMNR